MLQEDMKQVVIEESAVSISRTGLVKVIKIRFHSQKESVNFAAKGFVETIRSVFATSLEKNFFLNIHFEHF